MQHTIEEGDLAAVLEPDDDMLPLPPEWATTFWGAPMPNVVRMIRLTREGH
jgi:hypothetical protein